VIEGRAASLTVDELRVLIDSYNRRWKGLDKWGRADRYRRLQAYRSELKRKRALEVRS